VKTLETQKAKPATSLSVLFFVTIIIGIVSGIGGTLLVLLLHFIQHLAYGLHGEPIATENFLAEVSAASTLRKLIALTLCGLIAGVGWWALHRFSKPLVSIAEAIKSDKPHMPIGTTIVHALLQIITVGLGSPLGREEAPREIGATFACWFAVKSGLGVRDTQIMIACAAGAGLAAVYNLPFAGMMFTLEVLLNTYSWSALIPAITTSAIATVVSWIGLGNAPQYHLPAFTISPPIVIWSILVGPIFGFLAYWFSQIATMAQDKALSNWQLLVLCPLNFVMIGLLAAYFPALLGNGKGPIQLGFNEMLDLRVAVALLGLRILIVWTSFRAGAHGGLITPSLANGVLLAITLSSLWNLLWPGGGPPGAFAVVGAAAFLAAARQMPITAIILSAEFTGINVNFMIPIMLAITGSVSIFSLLKNLQFFHSAHCP
jgi:H+/Cl- antiporter ClcA